MPVLYYLLPYFCRVVYSSWFDLLSIVGPYGAHKLMVSLLVVLQFLHIFWFITILGMARKLLNSGKVELLLLLLLPKHSRAVLILPACLSCHCVCSFVCLSTLSS